MNYFELFDLPTQFDVEMSLLSSRFRELQKQFHPDKFASSSEHEKLLAVQQASQINDAYRVLKAPVDRAEYLLSLHGFDLTNEQHTMNDLEFLMEQMTLREELEAIEQRHDDDALADFETKVTHSYRALLTQVEHELSLLSWEQAAETVRKLKFIKKLKSEVERVEDILLD